MAETRILGMKELNQRLQALPAELGKKAVWTALGGAGVAVKKRATELVPVLAQATDTRKPGTVRDAIRVQRSKITRGQNGRYEVIVRVKPLGKGAKRKAQAAGALSGVNNPDDPFYWWYLEFGTSRMSARPFMRPAFENTKSEQLRGMRARMQKAIERHAAKIKQEVDNAN